MLKSSYLKWEEINIKKEGRLKGRNFGESMVKRGEFIKSF